MGDTTVISPQKSRIGGGGPCITFLRQLSSPLKPLLNITDSNRFQLE